MGMREQHPEPLMDIHPDTARGLGIADGDWAYIETREGSHQTEGEAHHNNRSQSRERRESLVVS